jgi:hypothetical protein
MLPRERASLEVTDEERNPFGRRAPRQAAAQVQQVDVEEQTIRGILASMDINGFIEGSAGNTALLGSMVLRENSMLPQLVEGQIERLQVISVNPDAVEIGFLERDGNLGSRTIRIPIRIRPDVRFVLGTQVSSPAKESGSFGGRLRPEPPDESAE